MDVPERCGRRKACRTFPCSCCSTCYCSWPALCVEPNRDPEGRGDGGVAIRLRPMRRSELASISPPAEYPHTDWLGSGRGFINLSPQRDASCSAVACWPTAGPACPARAVRGRRRGDRPRRQPRLGPPGPPHLDDRSTIRLLHGGSPRPAHPGLGTNRRRKRL